MSIKSFVFEKKVSPPCVSGLLRLCPGLGSGFLFLISEKVYQRHYELDHLSDFPGDAEYLLEEGQVLFGQEM